MSDGKSKLDDPEIRRQVLAATRAGADLGLAAMAVKCSRSLLAATMAKDPEFAEQMQEARDFADERVVKRLYDDACGGNTTAQIFWLKNRRPNEWRNSWAVTLSVDEKAKKIAKELGITPEEFVEFATKVARGEVTA